MADRGSAFLLVTILVLTTIVLIFAMKHFSATRQARLKMSSNNGYRDLAERAVKVQEDNAASLAALTAGLAEIDARLIRVEQILKEVE